MRAGTRGEVLQPDPAAPPLPRGFGCIHPRRGACRRLSLAEGLCRGRRSSAGAASALTLQSYEVGNFSARLRGYPCPQ